MSATRLKPVDVVVVGQGLAGTIIAKELAVTGLRVVGLERGRVLDANHDFAMPYAQDELKFDRYSEIYQNLARETVTFRNARDEVALPMREIGSFKLGECVGGAAAHWGGQCFRFHPWDFETRTRTVDRYGAARLEPGCTSQDWGITYEELEPYYDQFEHIYGIGGEAGNLNGEIRPGGNPFEGPRTREYPNPAKPPTYASALFREAAAAMGWHAYPTPTAAMSRTYTNPYRQTMSPCVSGGFCGHFVCAMGARATPITAVLPSLLKHPNFELRARCNVLRVDLDSSRGRAVGVTYADSRGREIEQPADIVILASYTFNNTRLLLLSGIGAPYDPVRRTGVVGRNYAYQTMGKGTAFFDDRKFNRFMGGGGRGSVVDDFNADNFDHSALDFFGGTLVTEYSNGATPIRSHPVPPGTPRWGSAWKRAVARYYDSAMIVWLHGACQSYESNYLDLDPTYTDAWGRPLVRMTFDFGDNDRRMQAYVASRVAEMARATNPAHVAVQPISGRYSIVPYQSTHNTGGAVMGADPATSVVNKYLQSWDVPNVFVVGGSAFPQNAAPNPSGTIGALACWAADAIKDTYLERPGPLA